MGVFHKIIVDELRRRGWSGYRLSEEAGLPQRAIQFYLAGEHDILAGRLETICRVLGLELRPVRGRKAKGRKWNRSNGYGEHRERSTRTEANPVRGNRRHS